MYFPILPRPSTVTGTPLIHSKPLASTAPAGLAAARANAGSAAFLRHATAPHFIHG